MKKQVCHARRANSSDIGTECNVYGCREEHWTVIEVGGGFDYLQVTKLRLCLEHAKALSVSLNSEVR